MGVRVLPPFPRLLQLMVDGASQSWIAARYTVASTTVGTTIVRDLGKVGLRAGDHHILIRMIRAQASVEVIAAALDVPADRIARIVPPAFLDAQAGQPVADPVAAPVAAPVADPVASDPVPTGAPGAARDPSGTRLPRIRIQGRPRPRRGAAPAPPVAVYPDVAPLPPGLTPDRIAALAASKGRWAKLSALASEWDVPSRQVQSWFHRYGRAA